jgi:catechol 2,3-dioxygenase-like lactoylglutathione lyase family enzyme
MFKIDGLDHVAITVTDMDRSIAWYQRVLGMEQVFKEEWEGVPAMMLAGTGGFALFPANDGAKRSEIGRAWITVQHIAFRVSRANFEAAQAHLKELDIAFEFSDHDVSHSIYFNDPDDHRLELTTYEL